jgi:hypothetical protein
MLLSASYLLFPATKLPATEKRCSEKHFQQNLLLGVHPQPINKRGVRKTHQGLSENTSIFSAKGHGILKTLELILEKCNDSINEVIVYTDSRTKKIEMS